jgi:multiple sugar transport system substrate-binding protein
VAKYLSITPPNNKQAVFDSLEYLVMPPSLENFGAIADDLMKYVDQAIAGNMTAKEALDAAQEEISGKY